MDARGFQHYKEQSASTMTQGELLLLLYDELVKRLMRCDMALEKGDLPLFEASAQRSIDILRYLDDTLDRRYPVSRDLHRMYDYFIYELQRVKIGRNRTELERIRPMIGDLRDAFRTADRSCADERRKADGAQ